MQVKAILATSPTDPLTPGTIERRAVTDYDVLIEIEYAGICHSDIHVAHSEWGQTHYPIVVGHEIIGRVTEVGAQVSKYAVGDRVGVGCMVESCGKCDRCDTGREQYCDGMVMTYFGVDKFGEHTNGGYSTHIVVEEDFVLRIPEGLASDVAAPLLCAGITMFSPLRNHDVGASSKVAIVGVGGLGHMGVKLAAAMGAEVTALGRNPEKADDALRLGAAEYYSTRDPETFEKLQGRFDVILNTVSAAVDLTAYVNLLAPGGTLVAIGLPDKPLELGVMPLVMGGRSVEGSLIGGIAQTQEMLDFCGEHGIGAEIELISADRVNEAYERVLNSDVKYRFVIDAATIK